MGNVARIEEKHGVGCAGVDMKRAGLTRLPKHLQDAGKIVMRQAPAKARVGLREHLRRLKAFGLADDDVANVRRDDGGLALTVDVVVAARLKRFHESAPAAVGESGESQIR